MGYIGLKHAYESDNAADFACVVFTDFDKLLAKHLIKEMKHKDNEMNTEGIINIGLLIQSFFKDIDSFNFPKTVVQVNICIQKIKDQLEKDKIYYNGEKNNYHKKSYLKLIKSMENWIDGS